MKQRPRRNRRTPSIRSGLSETHLDPSHLVWPVFIKKGAKQIDPISTLPGCARVSVDMASKEIEGYLKQGLNKVALFPVVEAHLKDPLAQESRNPKGLIPEALKALKRTFGQDLTLITDVALDPYSSDGHDGLVKNGKILNDETLEVLAQQALLQAQSGADFVAPSDMMDGRVGFIRSILDREGFQDVGIISYTAKYASSFYGPFREALESTPRFGDKKTYQMNPANRKEALLEAALDDREGADMLMVKPALSYLDVISALAARHAKPIAAYNVSGEYAMVKFASLNGALDERATALEILLSLRRAGASWIFTYHAPDAAKWLTSN